MGDDAKEWKQPPPDSRRNVLVWVSYSYEWDIAYYNEDDDRFYFLSSHYIVHQKQYITAWRELPSAPEGA